ncbi:hypothetical protein C8J57DRAFT_1346098 [Mycena rebaudengoi]|nr:hypothetical protein C8J57DRAFT_1346098 [Mycena rebaudengoi]
MRSLIISTLFPGCFSNGPKNCSSGSHVLQQQNSTASMKFKGSAIYVNALLDDISNTYIIDKVDGVRPGGPLLCYTLFSQSNLDPASISVTTPDTGSDSASGSGTPTSSGSSGNPTDAAVSLSGNPYLVLQLGLTSYSHMVAIGAIAVPLLILLSI